MKNGPGGPSTIYTLGNGAKSEPLRTTIRGLRSLVRALAGSGITFAGHTSTHSQRLAAQTVAQQRYHLLAISFQTHRIFKLYPGSRVPDPNESRCREFTRTTKPISRRWILVTGYLLRMCIGSAKFA